MVTVKEHEGLCRLINACRQGADNTTPMSLVQEMIDKIPEEIWKDPSKTILDPAAGSGTFLVAAYWKMIQAGDTHENIIENRLFACEVNLVYLKVLRDKLGLKNIYDKDFLQFDDSMKFDVVIGNPPYQDSAQSSEGKPIWHNFVSRGIDILTEDGFLCMIHPAGYRTGKSAFKNLFTKMKYQQIHFLKLSNYSTGLKYFNVTTTCDWYVLQKNNRGELTKVVDADGIESLLDLNDYIQLPDSGLEAFSEIVDLSGKLNVQILYNTAYHTQKEHLSKVRNDKFKYPIVYTLKQDGPSFWYSSRNDLGHFGVPKIILGRGLGDPVLDLKGEYGSCQFSYCILGSEQYLVNTYNALVSEECIEALSQLGSGKGHRYLKEVVRLLRVDFWKKFL